MKRIYCIILFCYLFVSVNAAITQTQYGSCGANLTWTLTTDGTLTISGFGVMEKNSFYAPWYSYKDDIINIKVENGIESICNSAFSHCECVKSVELPQTIYSIGDGAFYKCYNLASITIPTSVVSIGEDAFGSCSGLKSIYIPSSVQNIGENPFYGCVNLETIVVDPLNMFYDSRNDCNAILQTENNRIITGCNKTRIPDTTEEIYSLAFAKCDEITQLVFPKSLKIIYPDAFYACPNLHTINIPSYVRKLYGNTFRNCDKLETITIDSNNEIYDCRDNCNAIIESATNTLVVGCKSTIIPKTVTSIGMHAFEECSAISRIIIPDLVEYIEYSAFYSCENLSVVSLGKEVKKIYDDAFFLDNNIKEIYSHNSIPPFIEDGNDPFKDTDKEACKLYIPWGAKSSYLSSTFWRQFKNIIEVDFPVLGLYVTPFNPKVQIGDCYQLSAVILPEDAANKKIIWSSENPSVASVDQNGLVTANNVGGTMIKVKTTDGSNLIDYCFVTVTPIFASSITLNKKKDEVYVGNTTTLTATILPENATYKMLEWESSNKDIATVEYGIVKALSPGRVAITVKSIDGSNLTATCEMTVLPIQASSINLSQSAITINVAESLLLSTTIIPENTTCKDVKWTSSNIDVVAVDKGTIIGKSEGTAIITATTTDGSNLSATCEVKVNRHPQEIIWNQDLSSIVVGGELVPLTAYTSTGLPLVYTSNNEDVATIFDFGNAIYLNAFAIGTTDITVSQAGNDYYAPVSMTKTVNVIADPAGVNSITANANGKYSVYTINGLFVGEFTKDELAEKIKTKALARGVYMVNGKKMVIR